MTNELEELKRLTEYFETNEDNDDEVLVALRQMYFMCTPRRYYQQLDRCRDIIKNYILKAQEQEKVLDIIKNKCINNDNMYLINVSIDYEQYKMMAYNGINNIIRVFLKEEDLLDGGEFGALKEWVENDKRCN